MRSWLLLVILVVSFLSTFITRSETLMVQSQASGLSLGVAATRNGDTEDEENPRPSLVSVQITAPTIPHCQPTNLSGIGRAGRMVIYSSLESTYPPFSEPVSAASHEMDLRPCIHTFPASTVGHKK